MSDWKRAVPAKTESKATVSPCDAADVAEGRCETPTPDTAHASVLRRMVEETPPFRPDATSQALVREFARGQHRWPAYLALYRRGDEALPAIREGLTQAN